MIKFGLINVWNKKGDERILSFYWFILFVIVAIAIASAVIIFYSHQIDIREAEAGILGDRVVSCIVFNGQINSGVIDKLAGSGNLEKECNLVFADDSNVAYKDKMQYFVKVEAQGKLIVSGDKDFEAYCKQSQSRKNIPICVEKKLFVLDSGNEFTLVKILTAIRKVEQNAK